MKLNYKGILLVFMMVSMVFVFAGVASAHNSVIRHSYGHSTYPYRSSSVGYNYPAEIIRPRVYYAPFDGFGNFYFGNFAYYFHSWRYFFRGFF